MTKRTPNAPRQIDRAINGADDFVRSTNLGYVIMKEQHVSPELRALASRLFALTKIAEADGYSLYVPRRPD